MPRGVYDRSAARAVRATEESNPVPARAAAPDRCGTCSSLLRFDTNGNGGVVATCPKGHSQSPSQPAAPAPRPQLVPAEKKPAAPEQAAGTPCKEKACPGFGKPQSRPTCAFCDRRDSFAREHAAAAMRSCEICGGDFPAPTQRRKVCDACTPLYKKVQARTYAAKKAKG